jgi:hypothetical protein
MTDLLTVQGTLAPRGLAGLCLQVAADIHANLTAAYRRLSERDLETEIGLFANQGYRPSRSARSDASGGLFDRRYDGLTAYAADLDAAISRRSRPGW